MRCLGIPNTAHFANVTQIEDAVSRKCRLVTFSSTRVDFERIFGSFNKRLCVLFHPVWAKLKSQKASERWQPDTEVSTHSRTADTHPSN